MKIDHTQCAVVMQTVGLNAAAVAKEVVMATIEAEIKEGDGGDDDHSDHQRIGAMIAAATALYAGFMLATEQLSPTEAKVAIGLFDEAVAPSIQRMREKLT